MALRVVLSFLFLSVSNFELSKASLCLDIPDVCMPDPECSCKIVPSPSGTSRNGMYLKMVVSKLVSGKDRDTYHYRLPPRAKRELNSFFSGAKETQLPSGVFDRVKETEYSKIVAFPTSKLNLVAPRLNELTHDTKRKLATCRDCSIVNERPLISDASGNSYKYAFEMVRAVTEGDRTVIGYSVLGTEFSMSDIVHKKCSKVCKKVLFFKICFGRRCSESRQRRSFDQHARNLYKAHAKGQASALFKRRYRNLLS